LIYSISLNCPLQQCERLVYVLVVFEYTGHLSANGDLLVRITNKVANHADVVRVRKFDENYDVRALFSQGWMNRVPDTFVAVDVPGGWEFFEFDGITQTMMADPFGAPLPFAAGGAALRS